MTLYDCILLINQLLLYYLYVFIKCFKLTTETVGGRNIYS